MCNGRSNVTSGASVWPELHISSSLAFASTLSMGNTLVHVYAASGTRRVRQQSAGSKFWPPHIRRHHLRLCVGVAHQKDCRLIDFVRGVIRNAGSLVLSPRFFVGVHRPEGLRLVDFVRGVIRVIRSAGNLVLSPRGCVF